MIKFIQQLFCIEKKPRKSLFALEWVMMAYLAITLLIVFFTYTKAANPEAMIWGRIRIAFITVALWGVYRMLPFSRNPLCAYDWSERRQFHPAIQICHCIRQGRNRDRGCRENSWS